MRLGTPTVLRKNGRFFRTLRNTPAGCNVKGGGQRGNVNKTYMFAGGRFFRTHRYQTESGRRRLVLLAVLSKNLNPPRGICYHAYEALT